MCYSPSCPYISSYNRSFLNNRKISNEKIRYRYTKDFDGKILTSPSLIHTNFSLPQLFRNSEEFSMYFFRNVRLRKFNGKNLISPIAFLISFRCQKFSEATNSFHWYFSVLWDIKKSTQRRDIQPSHSNKFFATRNYLKHRRVPNELFRCCETQKVQERNVIFPRSQPYGFFATGNFLKKRRVSDEIFR